jgi:cytochrome P450
MARDWATNYDIFDPTYIAEPYPIWDELRQRCPVAHTDEYKGSWLPTTYEDITAIAHDVEHFSSRVVSVVAPVEEGADNLLPVGMPPISADPPNHTWTRRLLLPWFTHKRVAEYEPMTRELCQRLARDIATRGDGDAAAGYAQQIPVRVIASVLGVPDDMSDTFTGWVRDVLEYANVPERRMRGRNALAAYFTEEIAKRRENPGTDLISALVTSEVDGEPVPDAYTLGIVVLTLVAGVDTTWSGIGACLWHLATNPDDRKRLVADPDLIPIAIEEMLRAYSPVTMARIVAEDVEVHGCPMKEGDRVLLSFPSANRDPKQFPDADKVIIDRQQNRHVAFGVGIHRCAGSNLARMELKVAVEEWLRAMPEFRLADSADVTWAGGQVRGPRSIPVVTR